MTGRYDTLPTLLKLYVKIKFIARENLQLTLACICTSTRWAPVAG